MQLLLVGGMVLKQEVEGRCSNKVSAAEMISEALSAGAPLISIGILFALILLLLLRPPVCLDKVGLRVLSALVPLLLVVVVKVSQVGAVIEWKPVGVRPDSE